MSRTCCLAPALWCTTIRVQSADRPEENGDEGGLCWRRGANLYPGINGHRGRRFRHASSATETGFPIVRTRSWSPTSQFVVIAIVNGTTRAAYTTKRGYDVASGKEETTTTSSHAKGHPLPADQKRTIQRAAHHRPSEQAPTTNNQQHNYQPTANQEGITTRGQGTHKGVRVTNSSKSRGREVFSAGCQERSQPVPMFCRCTGVPVHREPRFGV